MKKPKPSPILRVDLGHASLSGPRPRNEDYCAGVTPEGGELENKGILVAVADGVGGHANGREASEYCVRSLLADYESDLDLITSLGNTPAAALKLANWPAEVRGFGPIRNQAAVKASQARETTRAALMA